MEGVTTKGFNSNKNKHVSSIVQHRINRMSFCNKRVWGTPEDYDVQIYAKIIGVPLSVLVQLKKMKVLQ